MCLRTDTPLSIDANVLLCSESTVSWSTSFSLKPKKRKPPNADKNGVGGKEKKKNSPTRKQSNSDLKPKTGQADVLSLAEGKGGKEEGRDELMLEQQGCSGSCLAGERLLRPHCVLCCSCGAVSTRNNPTVIYMINYFFGGGVSDQ